MSPKTTFTDPEATVESINAAHRPTRLSVRTRARRGLSPIEAALTARYRPELRGVVLEIGSRGDGLTDVLARHAASFTGIGFSAREVAHCHAKHPAAEFIQRGVVDLAEFEDDQFDAVVVGRCGLDRFGDDQRRRLLGRLRRVVADSGVLILSTHDLACESLVRTPLRHALLHPWTLASLPRALRNRALLGGLQQRRHGYAILNDAADGFGTLSYYISRDAQERQLHDLDYSLLECVDRFDEPVPPRGDAYRRRELYFVAAWAGARPASEARLLGGEIV